MATLAELSLFHYDSIVPNSTSPSQLAQTLHPVYDDTLQHVFRIRQSHRLCSDCSYRLFQHAKQIMYALTLAGIPISIGANEAVHQQRLLDEEAESDERQEEFYLDVFCDAKSRKKDEVHGAMVVLKDGKIRLWPKDAETGLPRPDPNDEPSPHPFTGFYLPFPSSDLPHRPMPAAPVLGLVSTVPPAPPASPASSAPSTPSPTPPRARSERTKPKLNWLYADKTTRELRYGPRSEAKKHTVGPWDWTEDEQGLTLDGEECLVAVEEERGGYGWAVYWDREDDCLKEQGTGKDKRVLRCSLERRLVEEQRVKGLDED